MTSRFWLYRFLVAFTKRKVPVTTIKIYSIAVSLHGFDNVAPVWLYSTKERLTGARRKTTISAQLLAAWPMRRVVC